jgi:hypothetical protein
MDQIMPIVITNNDKLTEAEMGVLEIYFKQRYNLEIIFQDSFIPSNNIDGIITQVLKVNNNIDIPIIIDNDIPIEYHYQLSKYSNIFIIDRKKKSIINIPDGEWVQLYSYFKLLSNQSIYAFFDLSYNTELSIHITVLTKNHNKFTKVMTLIELKKVLDCLEDTDKVYMIVMKNNELYYSSEIYVKGCEDALKWYFIYKNTIIFFSLL